MGPKKDTAKLAAVTTATVDTEPESLEDCMKVLKSLAAEFTTFGTRLNAVDETNSKIISMEARFVALEAKLVLSLAENKQLKVDLTSKNKTIEDLQSSYAGLESKCNDLEQYNRAWSVRIQNVPLSDGEEKNPSAVKNKVFNMAFLPILQGAYNSGLISSIPNANQLMEVAHVLPGKQGEHKPIIARFYDRDMKALCLRLKREHATRAKRTGTAVGAVGAAAGGGATEAGGRPEDRGWISFPFHEDLTRVNFLKMRAIGKHADVLSCWSVNGSLKFRLNGSEVIKRVVSVFEPTESIVKK